MHSFFLLQLWNKKVKVKGNNYYPYLLLSYRNKQTNVKIKPTSVLRKNLGQFLFKFITFIAMKYFNFLHVRLKHNTSWTTTDDFYNKQ